MPTVAIGDRRISRLVAGSNPILGFSYMGHHVNHHMREYFTTERTVEFLDDCSRAGIKAHQFCYEYGREKSDQYIPRLRERDVEMDLICLHYQRETIDEAIENTRPIALAHHGGVTDRMFAEGKFEVVHDYVKAVHDRGLPAGVSAHNPDCIRRIADEGWEVDFFMTSFFFISRRSSVDTEIDDPTLEISHPFFKSDPQSMTRVIREVDQPCLAFKIMAGGRFCSNQDAVRSAFQYAFENIKPSDGVIVGMFPWYFDEVEANARYTRELGA